MLLGSDYIVDLELSAAQAEGRGEVISSPRVITANQKEASIEQGVEIPYQESASSGATTIQFKKAVLSLKVTPQITPDNRIILDLNVKKDSVGQVIVQSGGVSVPSIDTREITTQVLVNDGQTVVLGGILETERSRDRERRCRTSATCRCSGRLFKTTRKYQQQGRAADLRHAEDPARRRQRLLTGGENCRSTDSIGWNGTCVNFSRRISRHARAGLGRLRRRR